MLPIRRGRSSAGGTANDGRSPGWSAGGSPGGSHTAWEWFKRLEPVPLVMTELTDTDRRRRDSRPDATFYDQPRFVTHADDGFLDRLTALYDERLEEGDRVFDAMGSWVSHLPDRSFDHVVGHGLNEAELAANDAYDEWFLQDFNANQTLRLPDGDRDAVVCALSVQYLQYPTAVFASFARVLAPDGVLVVSFTNRMFPTKAISLWRKASMRERLALVESYVERTDGLRVEQTILEQPEQDPFAAVVARKSDG